MVDQKSVPRKVGTAVAGVLLGGTLVAGSLVGQNTAGNSLEPKATAALQQAGITGVDVSFKGREAYISGAGKSQDELAQAQKVVESVYGVRWAKVTGDNSTATAPTQSSTPTETPTASPTASPSVTAPVVQPTVNIASSANGVALTGTVASQADADALAAQAERVFGSPVTNQLKVDPTCAQQPWVGNLVTALGASPAITGGSLTASGSGASIGGTVATDADLSSLQTAFGALGIPATVGATVATPPALTAAEIAQVNGTVVNFGYGAYTVDATGKQSLDAIIPLLAKSTVNVTIDGYVSLPHPDAQQIPDSQRRAQAVADYLIANGIDASRLTVQGLGATNPVASNDTSAGQTANQRATLTIS